MLKLRVKTSLSKFKIKQTSHSQNPSLSPFTQQPLLPFSLYKLKERRERERKLQQQDRNHSQIEIPFSTTRAWISMANNQNQKALIYSFVSRGTVILAEFTEFSGNFNTIAFQCLQKLPPSNNKFTYNCDAHTFNYLIDNGYSTYVFPFDLALSILFVFISMLNWIYCLLHAHLWCFCLSRLLNTIFCPYCLYANPKSLNPHIVNQCVVWYFSVLLIFKVYGIIAWIGGSIESYMLPCVGEWM